MALELSETDGLCPATLVVLMGRRSFPVYLLLPDLYKAAFVDIALLLVDILLPLGVGSLQIDVVTPSLLRLPLDIGVNILGLLCLGSRPPPKLL